ncbi:hypothetical protein [Methanosarcina horonobensis]|nr:hypothetical protein [Methanosarcina horonobensis]
MDSILKLMFENDQDLMSEFLRMQDGLGEYQTIMLATSWNLQKMLAYEEEASEDEFQALLKRCISTLGGTAADFFGTSGTGSPSRRETPEETNETSCPSKNS